MVGNCVVQRKANRRSFRYRRSCVYTIAFGEHNVNYGEPFARATYASVFENALGISMDDETAVRTKASELHIEEADNKNHWLLVSDLFDDHAEATIDPTKPTFITDYPSAISPLTRPHDDNPTLSHRWELFIAGMEIANSYTELNDPDLQQELFQTQLAGLSDEDSMAKMDSDFIRALRHGMPPTGGLGVGIDRLVMLLTNSQSIREIILFPLLRPEQPEQ